MISSAPIQLPLSLRLYAHASFDNFVIGDNGLSVEQLKLISLGDGQELSIAIHGQRGSGCTYLLQCCCQLAQSKGLSAIYLPLEEVVELSVDVFNSLESFDLVCIDQMQVTAGRADWEEALFHLFNRIRTQGHRLVIAATDRPDELGLELPDLRSPLNWGLVLQIRALRDEHKLDALKAQAKATGLNVSNEVLIYLMNRGERSLSQLFQLMEALDKASLTEKRRVTIPFAKQVLGWN